MKTYQTGPAILALLLAVILLAGLSPAAGAVAPGDGKAPQNGTYVISDGSPVPGYLTSSNRTASTDPCEQAGTYVWDQGGLVPADPCLQAGSQHHCTFSPDTCPGHHGHGSCG